MEITSGSRSGSANLVFDGFTSSLSKDMSLSHHSPADPSLYGCKMQAVLHTYIFGDCIYTTILHLDYIP